jgi:hypothetical protein
MSYGGAFLFLSTGRHEQVAGAIRLVVLLIFDVEAVFGSPCREVPLVANYINTACLKYRSLVLHLKRPQIAIWHSRSLWKIVPNAVE